MNDDDDDQDEDDDELEEDYEQVDDHANDDDAPRSRRSKKGMGFQLRYARSPPSPFSSLSESSADRTRVTLDSPVRST
jgi:hypothetical protein